MRDIAMYVLVFWVFFVGDACLPSVPSVNGSAAGAADAAAPPGVEDPPTWDKAGDPTATASPGRGGASGSTAHADGAVATAHVDARAEGADARATPDAGARVDARVDGGPPAASDAGDGTAVRTARAPRAGEVIVSELLVDPVGNDLGHEWIEVASLVDEPLDLGALHLTDASIEVAVDGGVLAARGRRVLGQSSDRAHNGDAPVDVAYGTKLSLNNGADRIALCAGPCADGLTLDVVEWTTAWGDAYVGHAVVVEPGTGATCPAAEPYGADGNFGTPGRENPPCPAAVPEPAEPVPEPPRDGG
jgi:hypothetical protein